jgi:hypothetical protein
MQAPGLAQAARRVLVAHSRGTPCIASLLRLCFSVPAFPAHSVRKCGCFADGVGPAQTVPTPGA